MLDCLFCRIASGEIQADVVSSNKDVLVIRDINPQAPVHMLVLPRRHFLSLDDLTQSDPGLMTRVIRMATDAARDEGLNEAGYRIVVNTGSDGGQTVPHVHVHVLGGRHMAWPPG